MRYSEMCRRGLFMVLKKKTLMIPDLKHDYNFCYVVRFEC